MDDIEIVSHPLCPHAQRLLLLSLLAGKQPGSGLKINYLAYETLQKTGPLHSPTGALPVLKLNGQAVSTNTDAIAEYLDTVFEAGMAPSEPLVRLRMREREQLVAAVLDKMRGVFTARDADSLQSALAALAGAAATIEANLGPEETPGALTQLDDIALAPLASLTGAFPALRDDALWLSTPRLKASLDAYRVDDRVSRSCCPAYEHEFEAFFAMTGSNFPALTKAS